MSKILSTAIVAGLLFSITAPELVGAAAWHWAQSVGGGRFIV